MKFAVGLARFLLGGVLLAAAGLKAMNPQGSALAVGAFQLTPPWLSLLGGMVLPGIEAITGAALWTGRHLYGACIVSGGLAVFFAGGVVSVMQRRLDLECGCFGHLAITPRAGVGTLVFDATLLVLSIFIALGSRSQPRN